MSQKSAIEWTDATLNIVVGCEKVSPGCDNCYAERLVNTRQFANPRSPRHGKRFDVLTFHPDRFKMLNTRKPTRFFVNSMSDLFHHAVPDEFIADAFWQFTRHPEHTFQILTKRPERMRRLIPAIIRRWAWQYADACGYRFDESQLDGFVPKNIWLGVSIESNAYKWRADMLRETPAAVRFLSLEPLLGPVDEVAFRDLDWIIVGGESGPGFRLWDGFLDEARVIRDRCRTRDIKFFFKQVAAFRPQVEQIPEDLLIREYPNGR